MRAEPKRKGEIELRCRDILKKHIRWYAEKIAGDSLDSYAAQVSFWVFIAFLPFLMFILALLRVIRIEDTNLLFAFAESLPAPVQDLLLPLFRELTASHVLLPTTAFVCLWSSSKGMLALVKGLYSVFDVPKRRNFIYMRLLAVLYTLAFVVVLLVSLGLLVFGDLLYGLLQPHLPAPLLWIAGVVKNYVGFLVLLFFFMLLFFAIPLKQVRPRHAFCGAVFSSAGWTLFSFFFSIFVENFSNYSTIYGSLAAIVILMIWLFACMYLLLLGGEAAVWLEQSGIRHDLKALFSRRRAGDARAARRNAFSRSSKGIRSRKTEPNGKESS